MFGFGLAFAGLFYILAQGLLAMSFQGYWRAAAILPLPVLSGLVIATFAFGDILPVSSETLLLLGLPMALIYLTILSAAHLAARMAAADRAHDPIAGRFRR